MHLLFEKRFIYNWTVSPDKPGLTDFFLFSLKVSLFGILTLATLGDTRHADVVGLMLTPFIEEQARTCWMKNAKSALRAGLMFAVFISFFELAAPVYFSRDALDMRTFIDLVAVRVVPTAMHFFYTFVGYQMLRRGFSAVRVWLVCAAIHLFFNEVLAMPIGDWVHSLQVGMRLL